MKNNNLFLYVHDELGDEALYRSYYLPFAEQMTDIEVEAAKMFLLAREVIPMEFRDYWWEQSFETVTQRTDREAKWNAAYEHWLEEYGDEDDAAFEADREIYGDIWGC